MTDQRYWDEQRKQRGCEKLGITAGQWSYIKRLGTMLRMAYEDSCNGFYDPINGGEDERKARRHEKYESQLEARAYKFAGNNGLYIYLQTDPRGATIYLDTEKIPENNYNKAVCIY